MKLIIDIDDDYYEIVKHDVEIYHNDFLPFRLIANGTPLPKGHGRLIDADALEKKMCDREEELKDDKAIWESSAVSVALDMFATTIVQADGGEEDG